MIRTAIRTAAAALTVACLGTFVATADTAVDEMAGAANAFLAGLDAPRKAQAVFEWKDAERFNWQIIPRERKGLCWKEMTSAQRHLATSLLATGLSQRGFVKATTIMSLEQILLELEQGKGPKRDPEVYFWSLFGTPSATGTWGWRVEGHHVSLNFTIVNGQFVSSTPSMFGTNPAEVREGPRRGLRVMGTEEDLGRQLLRSLDAGQRKVAVFSDKAPADVVNIGLRNPKSMEPAGLTASNLNGPQKKLLRQLIEEYVRRARTEIADADLAEIDAAGFDKVAFAWAGPDEPGQGHYYRVQGPTFLLEYDNTQNNANHIHAVWRELAGDFGEDLLARHYRETAH